MIRPSILATLLICTVCSFCGQDFISLGRHKWRCKQRVVYDNEEPATNKARVTPSTLTPKAVISTKTAVKCCCGKICKGARGLKMHQRSCQVIQGLNNELLADLEEQINANGDLDSAETDLTEINVNLDLTENLPELKRGIKLPKCEQEWLTAIEYFKFSLQSNGPITTQDLNSNITLLNNLIYDYFSEHFGYTESIPDKKLVEKYKNYTVKELKKALHMLKSNHDDLTEIKYVSRALRKRLKNVNTTEYSTSNPAENFNHDKSLEHNFWGYVKNILNVKSSDLPTFNVEDCFKYFTRSLAKLHPNKLFEIPNWIPKLSKAKVQFNLDPPTYQQITNVIRKMKSSGSPCPLDQVSIICFKRCPYLRTYLTELIRCIWLSANVPSQWKQACTILIHKKGSTNDPANFRPITLESIPLKVYTSCLRNAIYSFLVSNDYVESNIQKGFTPHLSGTLEHTSQMENIINKARIKQLSVVITLLDLKNAFGEVHHNLIKSVLDYHHIPGQIKSAIETLYTDFQTSIITSEFNTPFIKVGRGVLQGDCLSPLLFNMCFNTFIQHIKSEKYSQFGFSYKLLNPVHWFQFADDAAVITSQESENQHLLNRFSIWCKWADMIIRVDKCSSFGMKKAMTKSIQYLPKLLINNHLIPTVQIDETFEYLGRSFDFKMSDNPHKDELISLANDLMTDIDSKPLHPKNKLRLYSQYVLTKLSWHFTVTSISKTWVIENIDPIINRFVRKWLDIPIAGTLRTVFLPKSKLGLNFYPPSVKFAQCKTVYRLALKSSPNESIKHLWKSTSTDSNLQYDAYKSTKEVIRTFHSKCEDKLQNELTSQGSFFSNISKFSLPELNKLWSTVQSKLPKNIYNFTVRYINNSLPTRKNLQRWGVSPNPECTLCLNPETLLHVVAGCSSYLDRFTWRHNSVLKFLAETLLPLHGYNIYADLSGFSNPSIITGELYRPDLILESKNKSVLYVVELTVGFESNLKSNSNRKKLRYKQLIIEQKRNYNAVEFINLSISALGVFAKECSPYLDMLDDLGFDEKHKKYFIRKIMAISIRSTYYIFCCRNKEWMNPQLLNY